MRVYLLLSFMILMGGSCKKEQPISQDMSEASYKMTITGTWDAPRFSVPPNVHFTYFSGMVHNETGNLWKKGNIATQGLEAVAETGNTFFLFEEVEQLIAQKKAIAQINIPPPDATGSITRTFYCNSNYSYISFASMIAPSPDWFIGVSDLNLFQKGEWVRDTTLQLFVYDAGTEDGDVFGYNNPPSIPQQPIKLLTPATATVLANGNTFLAPIANVHLTRQ